MVEQIYKNLFKDENNRYIFAFDDDTRQVISQESYLLIYILEVLMNNKDREVITLTQAEKANE